MRVLVATCSRIIIIIDEHQNGEIVSRYSTKRHRGHAMLDDSVTMLVNKHSNLRSLTHAILTLLLVGYALIIIHCYNTR